MKHRSRSSPYKYWNDTALGAFICPLRPPKQDEFAALYSHDRGFAALGAGGRGASPKAPLAPRPTLPRSFSSLG